MPRHAVQCLRTRKGGVNNYTYGMFNRCTECAIDDYTLLTKNIWLQDGGKGAPPQCLATLYNVCTQERGALIVSCTTYTGCSTGVMDNNMLLTKTLCLKNGGNGALPQCEHPLLPRHAVQRSSRSLGFHLAQHSPTTRPSGERTAEKAFCFRFTARDRMSVARLW